MSQPQVFPALPGGKRIESGPVQFGSDWPCYVVRGDNALYAAFAWSMLKRELMELMKKGVQFDPINVMSVDGHFADMGRCDAQRFEAELKDQAEAGQDGC